MRANWATSLSPGVARIRSLQTGWADGPSCRRRPKGHAYTPPLEPNKNEVKDTADGMTGGAAAVRVHLIVIGEPAGEAGVRLGGRLAGRRPRVLPHGPLHLVVDTTGFCNGAVGVK